MESLQKWARKQVSSLMGLPEIQVAGIVDQLTKMEDKDLAEYCEGILGKNAGVRGFQAEFRRRRNILQPMPSPAAPKNTTGGITQGGRKRDSRKNNIVSVEHSRYGTIKITKKKRGKKGKGSAKDDSRKSQKAFVRAKCSCMATRHDLYCNCTVCGRIICQKEGEGPCFFCGSLVSKERIIPNDDFIKIVSQGSLTNQDDTDVKGLMDALSRRERMLKFSNEESRTRIIDDQGDYYEHGNIWLDSDEKKVAQELQELKEEEEMRSRSTNVTIDLLTRRVISNEESESIGSAKVRERKATEMLKKIKTDRKSVGSKKTSEAPVSDTALNKGFYENTTLKGRAQEVYSFLRQAVTDLNLNTRNRANASTSQRSKSSRKKSKKELK